MKTAFEHDVQPGMHALIAGVSEYPHLREVDPDDSLRTLGMKPLTSAARSAYKVFRWLERRRDSLGVKLASCHLLLSPTQEELTDEPGLKDLFEDQRAHPCTLYNFQTAAKLWRKKAATNPDNATFFYFAGHGLQMSGHDSLLVLQDFADGRGDYLDKTISTSNVYKGMNRLSEESEFPGTQFYFVDACRNNPEKLGGFERLKDLAEMKPGTAFTLNRATEARQHAPIFYATIEGRRAWAHPDRQTIFSEALLECLDCGAEKVKDNGGQERWVVSTHSLHAALRRYFLVKNKASGQAQQFVVDGVGQVNRTIQYLDGQPDVKVVLTVIPPGAHSHARVAVSNALGPVWNPTPPDDQHPYERTLPLGHYIVRADFDQQGVSYKNYSDFCQAEPPQAEWKVEC